MLRSILPRISGSKKLGFIHVMFSLAYTVVKVFQKKIVLQNFDDGIMFKSPLNMEFGTSLKQNVKTWVGFC